MANPSAEVRPMAIGPTVLITGAERGIGLAFVASLVDVPDVSHIFATCYNLDKQKFKSDLASRREQLAKFVESENGGDANQSKLAENDKFVEKEGGNDEASCITLYKKSGGTVQVELIHMDVTNDQSIDHAVELTGRRLEQCGFTGLNLLINNAGILDVPTDDNKEGLGFNPLCPDRQVYLNHFNVNTVGAVLTTAKFLPLLKKASAAGPKMSGVIFINTSCSSTNNYLGKRAHNNVAYAMSKCALNHYMKTMADPEYAGKDIISVAITPGWTATEMGKSYGTAEHQRSSVENSITKMMMRIRKFNSSDSGNFYSELTEPRYEYGRPYEF